MRGLFVFWLLVLVALAWLLVPRATALTPQELASWIAPWRDSGWSFPLVLGLFVAAGLLMAPVLVLMLATALIFDPLRSFAYTIAGSVLSAVVVFSIGRRLGGEAAQKLLGDRFPALRGRLERHGIVTVAIVRNLPLAPFPVMNLAAGAMGVRLRDFTLGTAIGLAPGVAGIQLLADRLGAAVRHPDVATLASLAAVGAALLGLGAILQRALDRPRA